MRQVLTALFFVTAIGAHAGGEYPSSKIKLLSHLDLTQLQARSGNTCWGYVSASGREYALMGCSNKTAIVEVTDPKNARIVATVPHSEGLWSDIKIYKDTCYVSSETSGTGIQVIDMSKVDEGKVTLIKTITTPGRSHTISVDPVGGYLYTCGSNEGVSKGASACFDLKDPHDPKRAGAETMTPVYQHESQVVTYTAGKYKGRTIFFGGGEGRGLEIWDVTNKDKPFLVKRVAYPFVGYCHQGWLNSDRRYFYVNDEFDESTNGIATRTLVFDVSDLENADLVSTYSTGKPSIDHNLYTRNDFVFHANYTTGLWIYDANSTPLAPRLCGYFDTFPANDTAQFEGAWSNYPLLPSGIVLISDINAGLFVVDASEATRVKIPATLKASESTAKAAGSTESLDGDSGTTVELSGKGTGTAVFEGTCRWQSPSQIAFSLDSKTPKGSAEQAFEFYNWSTGKYEGAGTYTAGTKAGGINVPKNKPSAYVEPSTKRMRVKVTVKGQSKWTLDMSKAVFTANP